METNDTLNQRAQECSLIMHAYGGLTHYPSENMSCYSEDGASAAGKSNLSPYAGVYSVDLYMSDPGNETTLGHRRWILSNGLGPIGLGSTSDFPVCMSSAVQVVTKFSLDGENLQESFLMNS